MDVKEGPTRSAGDPQPGVDRSDEEAQRVTGELLRIEGSLAAVRSEVDQLGELRDEHLRARLATLERTCRTELEAILPDPLGSELHQFLDWSGRAEAGDAELRLGLAQLEGWVDGVISALGFVIVKPAPATEG